MHLFYLMSAKYKFSPYLCKLTNFVLIFFSSSKSYFIAYFEININVSIIFDSKNISPPFPLLFTYKL